MKHFQKTIKDKITLEGIGVHTGKQSTITLIPAPPNSGITVTNPMRPDDIIKIGSIIPQQAMHATVLQSKTWAVSTLEHLMAALSSTEIDNVSIELSSNSSHKLIEVPIFDGSALPFVQAIAKTGTEKQNETRCYLTPTKPLIFEDKEKFIRILPASHESTTLEFDYTVDFAHPLVKDNRIKLKLSPEVFTREIAPARTFGFLAQLPFLRKHGLAQGTTLGNTVVVGEEVFLNSLRFEDEFIRHKLLDLIGDLALLGKPLAGTVIANKTGHSFNRLVIEHYINNPGEWRELAISPHGAP